MSGDPLRFVRLCLRAERDPDARRAMRALATSQAPDWERVARLAESERVGPLLYHIWRDEPFVPDALRQRLRTAYLATAFRNMVHLRELAAVVELLAAAGVPLIALKGIALAQTVYGNIALRPFVDLDVLLRREDLRAACQALTQCGFTPVKPETRAGSVATFENELLLVKSGEMPVTLEVHWSLFDSPFYQERLDLASFWRSAVPLPLGRVTTLMLDPVSMLLHLAGHLALHHGGEGLLWQYDIAAALSSYGSAFDWPLLLERARTFALVVPLREAVLRAAEDGAPVPLDVLDEIRRLTPTEDERRIVGYLTAADRGVAQRFWADLASMSGWAERASYAWTHLFPSSEYMRARYGIQHPWLLPLYYPYRWLLGLRSWRAGRT